MKRWLFTIFSCVSLLLFVAVCVLSLQRRWVEPMLAARARRASSSHRDSAASDSLLR